VALTDYEQVVVEDLPGKLRSYGDSHVLNTTSGLPAELIPMDARLGAPGRPQSATDQTAILTGTFTPRNPSA
jgi:hypothetical protein